MLGRFTFPPVCADAAEEADMAAETPVSQSLRVEPDILAVSLIFRVGKAAGSAHWR
jgi:hypothetical protein